MTDAQASEAARSLARARWGATVVGRAVATVIERSEQLDDAQRAALRVIAGSDTEAEPDE
jgi:hypothetical protein